MYYEDSIRGENIVINFCSCNHYFEMDPIKSNPKIIQSSISQATIIINNVIIGSPMCPSELIRVKTGMYDYLIQVFYDSSAQVSICDYQCGPLVTGSRLSPRQISITTVFRVSRKIRKSTLLLWVLTTKLR